MSTKVPKLQNIITKIVDGIRKRNPDLKSRDQIGVIQNIENVFGLRQKMIGF